MRYKKYFVRFQVQTAVLWDLKPCSLVDGYDYLGEAYCPLKMDIHISIR
jgi:hypothetical protein